MALERVVGAARDAGLLVVADGKRGDVPHTAAVYAEALFEDACGADAATVNPLLGADALEPLIEARRGRGSGRLRARPHLEPGRRRPARPRDRRTGPVHEHLARLVAASASRLAGASGLSGMGAVVGATEPASPRPAA